VPAISPGHVPDLGALTVPKKVYAVFALSSFKYISFL